MKGLYYDKHREADRAIIRYLRLHPQGQTESENAELARYDSKLETGEELTDSERQTLEWLAARY